MLLVEFLIPEPFVHHLLVLLGADQALMTCRSSWD